MGNRSIPMYEYRQVILRMRLGESNRAIGKSGLICRKKAKSIRIVAEKQGWLNLSCELPEDTALLEFFEKNTPSNLTQSQALPYCDDITKWTSQGIQGTTIYQTLKMKYQFTGSYDCVRRFIQKLKAKEVKASMPLDFLPGESVQVDFGMGPMITDVYTGEIVKTWIFVMVLSWSRHQYAEIVTNQKVETWLGCHKRAFEFFNGVPKRIIIDNAKCAITKACYYDPLVQRAYAECAEHYGFIISACPPREPKKKGRVESGVKYVKNNFVPLREFRDLVDANAQLRQWVLETAGNRKHGSTYEKPLTLFQETEKYILTTLPEKPFDICIWVKVTLHGDCHAQYEKCRYSAPYQLVSQLLWLRASESSVRIYKDHEMVAVHPRLTKPGSRHTIDEHLPPNGLAYKMRDPQWCLKQAKMIGDFCYQIISILFAHKVLDQLRAAQGIVGLKDKFGAVRLEAACKRALAFEAINYHSIKNILNAGIEYQALDEAEAFDRLTQTYTGSGQFCRDIKSIIQ